MTTDNHLTQEEIEEVLSQAAEYALDEPEEGVMLHYQPTNFKSVIWLTPKHKLIVIQGNDHIGFNHISKRHYQNSPERYWNPQNPNKPFYPGRFLRGSIPFGDIQWISDYLFEFGIKNKKKKEPRLDSYTGVYKHEDGQEIEYLLVVYEGTKIIVTLFPTERVGNLKHPKGFLWNRGKVFSKFHVISDKQLLQITIPYLNNQHVTVFSIYVKYEIKTLNEQVFIGFHDDKGKSLGLLENQNKIPLISERTVPEIPPQDILTTMFQLGDLDNYEQIMLDAYNNKPK